MSNRALFHLFYVLHIIIIIYSYIYICILTAGIGFTAWATSVVRYSAGTALIFNGMDEEHNGFDKSTGLFTCPRTGIYYVYVTLRKHDLNNIHVDVFKMDTRIIRFSENDTGNSWNTVSNSALVSCSIGEIIQMKGWSSGSIYGDADVRCSSFTVINVDQIGKFVLYMILM